MKQVYAVTSGSYSDYNVLCLFEISQDALAYALALNRNAARSNHNQRIAPLGDGRPWNREHNFPFEECLGVECRRYRAQAERGETGEYRIETFDLYAAGETVMPERKASDE